MEHLKENLAKKQMLICGGKLFHICCAAHVLNLIVKYGLFVMKGLSRFHKLERICLSIELSGLALFVRRNPQLMLPHGGT
jgi:hypothetical protein